MYDSLKDGRARQFFNEATQLELNQLQEDFEKNKLTLIPIAGIIQLPTPKSVRERITNKQIEFKPNAPITYNSQHDRLEVTRLFVREKLFETPCALINATILKVLKEQTDIKIVVLVGGFAESDIVQEDVRSKIQETYPEVKVVVPTSPFRAVLTGAVLFGHNPAIFKSRISRATYGIATNQVFDESKHDLSKKWHDEENKVHRCKDVFSVHVKKGEHVSLNEEREAQTYTPIYKSQKEVGLDVYESSEVGPTKGTVMYTTDIGCKKLGRIDIEVPTAEESSERGVSVRMIYGGTQLSVIAKCAHTGKECRTQIRFD
ncbi:hypothetical protein DPMN_125116 [Dreissena polymorpha]|uniref:Uncharacterized protein n=1 Tax=Dreissena polymorpha TaxID=45954 RepID=A0A9D4GUT4_DREPO|nr:hypothetical protein DPMN_125116 [Dreissena polymorpha]